MVKTLSHIIFCFIILQICVNSKTFAQKQQIIFDQITLDDGLSESTVESIFQDQQGYMWFGTVDGLNKFDGYNFTIFRNDKNDTSSISENWITSLFVDKEGTLWLGTIGGCLNNYNREKNNFNHYHLQAHEEKTSKKVTKVLPYVYSFLTSSSIKAICEDDDGNLWIGTFGLGLFKFDRKSEKFTSISYGLTNLNDFAYYIMSICRSSNNGKNTIWIGTFGGGLLSYEKNIGFNIYHHDSTRANSLSDNHIMTVYSAPKCNKHLVWIGTYGSGLVCYHITENKFTNYRNEPDNANSLSSNEVSTILQDDCGNLWIGTIGAGLNKYDIQNKKFNHFRHDQRNQNSLNNDDVLVLYKDRTGIIWIGTHLGNGINKFDHNRNKFTHYFSDPSNPNSLNDNTVVSMCVDRAGIIWLGTFQGGLNKFDRVQNKFTHYKHDPLNHNSISDNHIRAIFEDRDGILWVGTYKGGLNKFNKNTNSFKSYKHSPSDPFSIGHDQVRAIFEDRSGTLWVGTFGGSLNRFDRKTEKFYRYRHEPTNATSISDDQIYSIIQDNYDDLWIATFEGGLNQFNLTTEKFIHYKNDPTNPNSISSNRVLSILEDPDDVNILWIGTHGGGLNKFDRTQQIFKHYTKQDGLPNDIIYGILPDSSGNLWLSTNRGISWFNPHKETYTNYDRSDGLQSNEFNAGAYFKSRLGELYFGGINGFNCFYPEHIKINNHIPPIVLTSFKIFDKETSYLIGPISEAEEIVLSYKANFFSFEFSALDYTNVQKNQFAFKLDGLDDKWIHCGKRHYVSYTNLDPGEYTFKVKGANSDGVWNEKGTFVNLKILPPFWRTRWFYLFTAGLLLFFTILFHRHRVRINIKRSLELERIRMTENERVRKTVAADFHDELGQKLTRISLFSEIIKRKLESISPENIDYIEKINISAKELSSSTRDFIWTLDPIQDSLYDVLIYLKDFGDEMFDKTGIYFNVDEIPPNFQTIKLPMKWRRHLILIFKEAMNNILKHAKCSSVNFKINLYDSHLEMALSDNGSGFDMNHNATGNGLRNMKSRAETIESELFIKSNSNSGTEICFKGEIP